MVGRLLFLWDPAYFFRGYMLVLWSVTWICLCQTHNLILPILMKVFVSPMDSFVGFNDLIFVARTKGEKMVRRVETRDPWRSCGGWTWEDSQIFNARCIKVIPSDMRWWYLKKSWGTLPVMYSLWLCLICFFSHRLWRRPFFWEFHHTRDFIVMQAASLKTHPS